MVDFRHFLTNFVKMNDPLKGRYDLLAYLDTGPTIADLRKLLRKEQRGRKRPDMVKRILGRIHTLEKKDAYGTGSQD